MTRSQWIAALAAVALAASSSCKPSHEARPAPTPAASTAPAPAPAASATLFSKERAWKHLEALVAMGPRAHGLPGQALAQQYIRDHLRASGAVVRDLSLQYRGSDAAAETTFVNIVGGFGERSAGFAIIGSHYDTRLWADEDPDPARRNTPIDGANDGGSGTAVLLELATVLHESRPAFGVDLVFFDGEDFGRRGSPDYFIGSKDMAARLGTIYGGARPAFVVVVDMVGDAELHFQREAHCEQSHRWLNDRLWEAGRAIAPAAFSGESALGVTDDHTAFLRIGIAATLLIDFDYPYWHTAADTLDKCSAESLGVTGRVLLAALVDTPLPAR
jgi:Zn-dependent M28 family amino/carboxypeptidase